MMGTVTEERPLIMDIGPTDVLIGLSGEKTVRTDQVQVRSMVVDLRIFRF